MKSVRWKYISTFGKFSISVPIALTTYTGFVLFDEKLSLHGLLAAVGIFFMSAGASALNQVQENKWDLLMPRTSKRPLPVKAFSFLTAFSILFIFFLLGSICLYSLGGWALFWGWIGVLWYNGIYTPLKRWSAFSVFPGAVVGVIPPIAGWIAAGGSLLDARLHFLVLFFFLGQMPHFWLLVLKYDDQLKAAGFPTIAQIMSKHRINQINLVWFLATFLSVLFLPVFDLIRHQFLSWIVILSSLFMMGWSVYMTCQLLNDNTSMAVRKLFIHFNTFYLWVMVLIVLDQVI